MQVLFLGSLYLCLKLYFAVVNFLKRGDKFDDKVYDYGNFILLRKSITIPDALTFIDNVSQNETIGIEDWEQIHVKTRTLDLQNISSYTSLGFIYSEWASLYAYFIIFTRVIAHLEQSFFNINCLLAYFD